MSSIIHIIIANQNNFINFALELQKEEETMPEYEHNREERMHAVMDAAIASKENATDFLIRAGILEPSGEFAAHLR